MEETGIPLLVVGVTVDGIVVALVPTVEVGETVTLTAYAPAAVSYQWYRDGEPVEGATGSETSVSWMRGVKSAVYTVKAKFIVNGQDVTRESSAATVTMRPLGMLILFR